jgi:hypothetical protein
MTFAKYPVSGSGGGTGDVVGPVSSVDNGLALFDGVTGKLIKDAGVGSANQVLVTNGATPAWSGTPSVTGMTLSDFSTGFKFNNGTANVLTIEANVPTGAQTLTIPIIAAGSTFILNRGAQSFEDTMFFKQGASVITSLYMSATLGGNEYTITPVAPAANRAYSLPDAGGAAAFVMSAGNSTIGGTKTFSSGVVINPTTNQLVLGVTNTTTINSVAPSASRVYTIPDAGANTSFVMAAGTQTVAGAKTFSTALTINPTTNQLVLGVTNTVTISSTAPSASRVLTIPDTGGAANFIFSAFTGTQTIGGTALTLSPTTLTVPATITFSGVNTLTKSGNFTHTLTTTATSNSTFPAGTQTLSAIGLAETFSAIKTFSAAPTFTGGTAANASIWFASNVLRQRGGTSGWAVDNTSGTEIIGASDAGALTAGPNAGSAGSINHLARGSQRLSTLQYSVTSGGVTTETTPTTRGNNLVSTVTSYTDLSTTARNIANGLSIFPSGIHKFVLINVDGDEASFEVSVGFENGVAFKFSPITGSNANCSISGTSTLSITGLGDGRTYTLAFNTGSGAATLASSTTATGTTTLHVYSVRWYS